jgi:hypothetical protein
MQTDLLIPDMTKFFFKNNFLWPQAWSLNPLPEVFTVLYEGRAAVFEPELFKLAALPRYQ